MSARDLMAFATYNAGIRRARNAYRADQAVERGMCAICQTRRRGEVHRACLTCRRGNRAERRELDR